jgi:YgiT-type zinc finger domain-containing protein
MKCAICRNGMTESGYTTVLLEKDYTTLVFKNVPAQICRIRQGNHSRNASFCRLIKKQLNAVLGKDESITIRFFWRCFCHV